jgi:YfiH family protein
MQSTSIPNSHSAHDIEQQGTEEIDALFEQAGLVRNLRGKAAGITRRVRLERAAPEELSRSAPAPRVAPNGVHWLAVPAWEKFSCNHPSDQVGQAKPGRQTTNWLWHGFSTRRGGLSRAYCAEDAPGELNLGFTADDDRETVIGNRRLLAEAVTGDLATLLITIRQIHSSALVVIGSGASANDAARERAWKADGLMTDEPGLLLGVQTADCIPVLVADRKRRSVAAFHAGWRGTVKRIVECGIGRMRLEFGSRPEDLVAAIGPGIGACCYAVGEDALSSFESQFVYSNELFREVYDTDSVRTKYPMLFLTQRAPGHSPMGPNLHLDLVEANRRQLLDAGLKPRSIQSVGGCTSCQPELFFSHRASQGRAGRMMSVIGIRPR